MLSCSFAKALFKVDQHLLVQVGLGELYSLKWVNQTNSIQISCGAMWLPDTKGLILKNTLKTQTNKQGYIQQYNQLLPVYIWIGLWPPKSLWNCIYSWSDEMILALWYLFCWTFAKASFKQNWKNKQRGRLRKEHSVVCYHSTYDMIMFSNTFLKKLNTKKVQLITRYCRIYSLIRYDNFYIKKS